MSISTTKFNKKIVVPRGMLTATPLLVKCAPAVRRVSPV
jgi:hypothetical protein